MLDIKTDNDDDNEQRADKVLLSRVTIVITFFIFSYLEPMTILISK
jgi:hypothetical protein